MHLPCPRWLLLPATCLLLFITSLGRAQDPDLQRVQDQLTSILWQAYEPSSPSAADNTSKVAAWMTSLNSAGRWPDIPYDDQTRGNWPTIQHLNRLLEMAKAYASPSGKLRQNPPLLHAIHSSLDLWLDKDYRNPNWWQNEIGVPRAVACTLLLMQPQMSPDEMQRGLQIIARSKIGMTGQNKVWLAGNVLMRALLQNDATLVQTARDVINAEIIVTSADEGLQADFSFHQHGPQLQQGNYGLAFASDGVFWQQILRDTRFALSPEKVRILRDYLLNGENTVVWNGLMDISSCGRQLFPDTQAVKARTVSRLLASLVKADPAFAPAYQKALLPYTGHTAPGDQLTGNRMFWRSDYMVDRRPGYYASVKMSSARTIGAEVINNENLSGRYLGDGALYLYKTGQEYTDIFPVWDWRKLPGVTCADSGPVRPSGQRNRGVFVGGASDGHDGVAALDYDRDGVKAKKSWFFFDNRIVCLGAGITAGTGVRVTTSVNQCLLRGPVLAAHDNQTVTVTGRHEDPALQWAWHDGTGYVLPRPVTATVGGAPQTGSWQKNVYAAGAPAPVTKDVFSLCIDHGLQPHDASYACVILPSASAEQVQLYSKTPDVVILENSPQLQAVRCGQSLSAVFYQPGRLTGAPGIRIEVDQPCLLLLTGEPNTARLTVADPTHKLSEVTVTRDGHPVKIPLPSGGRAGDGVTLP